MPEKRTVVIELEVHDWAEYVTLDYVGVFAWQRRPEYNEQAGMFAARSGGRFERIVASNGATIVEIPKNE